MAKEKCSICDGPVDISNLHPDSLKIPINEDYTVVHTGCANGEDRWNGANPTNEDLEDDRAWIIYR